MHVVAHVLLRARMGTESRSRHAHMQKGIMKTNRPTLPSVYAIIGIVAGFGCSDATQASLDAPGDSMFEEQAEQSFDSIESALSSSSQLLPLKADDLPYDHAYYSNVHGSGIQAFGRDIGSVRYLADGWWSFFTEVYDSANPKPTLQNAHYLAYGKPFYAMASGVVVGCWRNARENPPGSLHADASNKRMAGGGNHLWILQDDGNYALYAHAQPGSIPSSLCPHDAVRFGSPSNGAGTNPDIDPNVAVPSSEQVRVSKGQMLGRIGNSGSSSGPHLHIHLERNSSPVHIKLERGLYLDVVNHQAFINDEWQEMRGADWPEKEMVFWPHHTTGWGSVTWNSIPSDDFQRWFDHWSDSGYMADTIGCRKGGSTMLYDTTWVQASGKWRAYAGLSQASFDSKKAAALADGYRQTAEYTCRNFQNAIRKCGVFRK